MSIDEETTTHGAHWYAQPNDLIGGWCVMDVDLPPSQTGGSHFMADGLSESQARYIASMRNAVAVPVLSAEPTDAMVEAFCDEYRSHFTVALLIDEYAVKVALRAALAAGDPR